MRDKAAAVRGSPLLLVRWHNQLNPDVKKEPFSEWEDAVIIQVSALRRCSRGSVGAPTRTQKPLKAGT
jgi:hypothetical protein